MFYRDRKNKAIEAFRKAESIYNDKGTLVKHKTLELYGLRKGCSVAINNVMAYLTLLANSPQNYKEEVESVQDSIEDFNQAVKKEEEKSSGQLIDAKIVVSGITEGSVWKSGLTMEMLMAYRTTFGPEFYRMASALHGIATHGAFAWLSSGIMGAGLSILRFGGPVGWGIAGILSIGCGLMASQKNREIAEEAERALHTITPKIADMEHKLQELKNLCTETDKLLPAIDINKVCGSFPKNYYEFTDDQKLRLGALINSTKAMGVLINKQIS